tara:strand:- start:1075 stop:1317 length:243 start_codon:yes stop_codon:yes gene_type:complete
MKLIDNVNNRLDVDMNDFNRIDLGSNFGATFFLNDVINIDIRYSLGILKLDEAYDEDLFNNSIQISVSYMFGGLLFKKLI